MSKILILYSSTNGHTAEISRRLGAFLVAGGDEVRLERLESQVTLDLQGFDKIVLGARIRYGKHAPEVFRFVRQNLAALERVPSAFFTVNLVARKPEKAQVDSNPYLGKFLQQLPWRPNVLGVFAGKINYPEYGPLDRAMIRCIMWLTQGPTAPDAVIEFTDWPAVEAFAQRIAAL